MFSNRTKGYFLACLAALCWAILAPTLKYALQIADVGTITWFRFSFSALVLFFFFSRTPQAFVVLKRPPLLALAGALAITANYFLYFKGLELTTAANAQVLIQFGPLLFALMGFLFFGETLTWRKRFGILIALIGFSLFHWDHTGHLDHKENPFVGNMVIFVAAVLWAVWASLNKILVQKNWQAQQLNLLTYIIGAIVLLPLVNFSVLAGLNFSGWLIMISLGLNTVIAYGSMGACLKYIEANQASMIITLNPLGTLFILHLLQIFYPGLIAPEPLGLIGYLGALVLVVGVILTVLKTRPAAVSGLLRR